MDTDLNQWSIADGTVRITLFRVLPGHEIQVGRLIEEMHQSSQHPFRVFRLFGSYDLVFITDSSSLFSDEFAHMGTIPYIIGVDEYLCYKWKGAGNFPSSFSIDRLNDSLLALCFLKLNPQIVQKSGLDAEINIVDLLRTELPDIQVVGTFGWFETILLLSDSSLGHLLKVIGNKIPNSLYHRKLIEENTPLFLVEKSFTLLGHHLDVSDPHSTHRRVVSLEKDDIKKGILTVNLSLSCKPSALRQITQDAIMHFQLSNPDELNFLFGPRDITINVPLRGVNTLNQLLDRLDGFRAMHIDKILKTYTDVLFQRTLFAQPEEPFPHIRHPIINLTKMDASKLTGLGEEGRAIASAIYGYNNLLQNNLGSDAFFDLLEFVRSLRDLPVKIKEFKNNLAAGELMSLVQRLNLLEEAIDQRSQGVYTGFDETPFTPGFTGTAMVRIYKALEAYIGLLLGRFQDANRETLRWPGFVMFGSSSRFEQKDSVVIIPQISSLKAISHWCLTHECMHILQYLLPDILSLTTIFPKTEGPVISRFRVIEREYGFLMLEMTADVLDYSFFCPGHIDFEDYVKIIWSFLSDVVIGEESQITNYLFRSFGVLIYAQKMANPQFDPDRLTIAQTRALIREKESLYKEIDWLKQWFNPIHDSGVTLFGSKIDEFHRLFVPGLKYLFSAVDKVHSRYFPKSVEELNVDDLIGQLNDGRILDPQDILYPELITWTIARNFIRDRIELSEKGDVALLLSLWNIYHKCRLGTDISKFAS